ncbi:unnamed protein product [Chrysoparadoxa australica]
MSHDSEVNSLAGLLKAQGKYEAAEPLYRSTLTVVEKAGWVDDLLEAFKNGFAGLLEGRGKYKAAEPWYRRALAVREKALGVDHPEYAATLHNLARRLQAQGKYEAAEPLYKSALAVFEKALGVDHPSYAATLHSLAGLLKAQGKYEAAEPLYRSALVVVEKALGVDHPSYAATLYSLAGQLKAQGKYEDAEPLCRSALAVVEKALGVDHPKYAVTLINLAGLLQAQGKYEAAEPLYRSALAVFEKVLGVDHPSYAATLHSLAGLLKAQGKYEAAEPLYRSALAVVEKALGVDHPEYAATLHSLAGLLQAQGKYEAAEPLYRRTLAVFEKALGVNHPLYTRVLANLAGLLVAQLKYEAAGQFVFHFISRSALAIREKALGVDDPEYAMTLDNLAGLPDLPHSLPSELPDGCTKVYSINLELHPAMEPVLLNLGAPLLYDVEIEVAANCMTQKLGIQFSIIEASDILGQLVDGCMLLPSIYEISLLEDKAELPKDLLTLRIGMHHSAKIFSKQSLSEPYWEYVEESGVGVAPWCEAQLKHLTFFVLGVEVKAKGLQTAPDIFQCPLPSLNGIQDIMVANVGETCHLWFLILQESRVEVLKSLVWQTNSTSVNGGISLGYPGYAELSGGAETKDEHKSHEEQGRVYTPYYRELPERILLKRSLSLGPDAIEQGLKKTRFGIPVPAMGLKTEAFNHARVTW